MNTAKFNHLYKIELANEITQTAFNKILDVLEPIFKKSLTREQISNFVSNGGTRYQVDIDWKTERPGNVPELHQYGFNCIAGIQKDVGLEWMHATKGTFPKRFASYMYKNYGLKLDTKTLSKIGTVASAANSNKSTMYFDIFDCANERYWNSGRYGDSGSCLWGGRGGALDIFKDNGVMALRTYYDKQLTDAWKASKVAYPTLEEWFANQSQDVKPNYGRGRAWMHYIPDLDAYIFWNGYDSKGELQAIHYARLWATTAGMTYHKLQYLNNNGSNSSTVYINSGSGWIVHAMDNLKATNILDYDFKFKLPKSVQRYECEDCGWQTHDEDDLYRDHSGRLICSSCRDEYYHECADTGDLYHYDELVFIEGKGAIIDGRRYAGNSYYNDSFIESGRIVFTEDTEIYMWAKDAYKDEDGFYWEKKPEKVSII